MRRPARLPLSFTQLWLWRLDRLHGPGLSYNAPAVLRLLGALDADSLEAAIGDVAVRHESLRTVFRPGPDEAEQVILDADDPRARPVLHRVPADECSLPALLAERVGQPVRIEREPAIRPTLFRLGQNDHVLLLQMHYFVSDGGSAAPLARDLGQAYRARLGGKAPEFPALPVQYADYALWQRETLGEETNPGSLVSRQYAYWQGALAGLPASIALPADRPRLSAAPGPSAYLKVLIEPALQEGVRGLARACGASLFMVLLSGLALLLSKLGGGTDIPIGSSIAGRTDAALDDLIGLFMNVLVMRTDLSGDPSVRQLVGRVRDRSLAAYANQELPPDRLARVLGHDSAQDHGRLFQVMFLLQNYQAASFELPGITAHPLPVGTYKAKFDLVFSLTETGAGLAGYIEYATDLFDPGTIEAMSHRYARLLGDMAGGPERRIGGINVTALGSMREVEGT